MNNLEMNKTQETIYSSNNPLKYWLYVLKHSLDFKTRSPRKEFWMFYLGNIIVFIILISLLTLVLYIFKVTDYTQLVAIYSTFVIVWRIVLLLPALSLQTRRFHDLNKSGFYTILFFVCNFLFGYLSNFFEHISEKSSEFGIVAAIFIICFLVDIWLFVLLGFIKGSSQENKYGSNPIA